MRTLLFAAAILLSAIVVLLAFFSITGLLSSLIYTVISSGISICLSLHCFILFICTPQKTRKTDFITVNASAPAGAFLSAPKQITVNWHISWSRTIYCAASDCAKIIVDLHSYSRPAAPVQSAPVPRCLPAQDSKTDRFLPLHPVPAPAAIPAQSI